ncbi:MAG: hypothetical protein IJ587_05130 [Synergistaceae bacterium]|nr:hypothetical protein [Synergistaceae bacterium]
MIYGRESELGGRMDRKLARTVQELQGSCELLACDAETLNYQLRMTLRGQSWREILKQIRAEAEEVLNQCGRVEELVEMGVLICRF